MDLKKHIISNTILKLFVHIVLVIGFIFSLITINQGIVVGENILSENNYSLVIGIIIFAIILLIVLSSYTVFINLKKYKLSKKNLAINNKIKKNYE
ncbi:MAG TPA: hypothetical protein GX742_03390, partial [Acholeplasmataceae bacterium]|nr:hypothetical protein [Acholeplasmataceae bacterium]